MRPTPLLTVFVVMAIALPAVGCTSEAAGPRNDNESVAFKTNQGADQGLTEADRREIEALVRQYNDLNVSEHNQHIERIRKLNAFDPDSYEVWSEGERERIHGPEGPYAALVAPVLWSNFNELLEDKGLPIKFKDYAARFPIINGATPLDPVSDISVWSTRDFVEKAPSVRPDLTNNQSMKGDLESLSSEYPGIPAETWAVAVVSGQEHELDVTANSLQGATSDDVEALAVREAKNKYGVKQIVYDRVSKAPRAVPVTLVRVAGKWTVLEWDGLSIVDGPFGTYLETGGVDKFPSSYW